MCQEDVPEACARRYRQQAGRSLGPSDLRSSMSYHWRWRQELNLCTRLCKPLPRHSATPPGDVLILGNLPAAVPTATPTGSAHLPVRTSSGGPCGRGAVPNPDPAHRSAAAPAHSGGAVGGEEEPPVHAACRGGHACLHHVLPNEPAAAPEAGCRTASAARVTPRHRRTDERVVHSGERLSGPLPPLRAGRWGPRPPGHSLLPAHGLREDLPS
jgi:hypothetical protein